MPVDTLGSNSLGLSVSIFEDGSQASVGFDNSIVLVGGYDASNADASVTAGEAYAVADESEAGELFGTDSELAYAVEAAYANGVADVTAVPVAETTGATASFAATSSGMISDAPIFDPNVQPEHSISVQDTVAGSSVDHTIVYESPPASPSSGMNINPVTGEFTAASSSDYDITYDHGDYIPAIETAAAAGGRFVAVLSEADAHGLELRDELDQEAEDFDLHRGMIGALPDRTPTQLGNYDPNTEDYRLVEVAPSRGTLTDGSAVRSVAAIAARAAAAPLGDSLIYADVGGLNTLRTNYKPSEAGDAQQLTTLSRDREFVTVQTTSTVGPLQDIFKAEIVDEVAVRLSEVLKPYAGSANTETQRNNLRSAMIRTLDGLASGRPPLLSTGEGTAPYTVDVSLGANDSTTDVRVGVEPLNVMKHINLNLAVGEVVTFDGVSA